MTQSSAGATVSSAWEQHVFVAAEPAVLEAALAIVIARASGRRVVESRSDATALSRRYDAAVVSPPLEGLCARVVIELPTAGRGVATVRRGGRVRREPVGGHTDVIAILDRYCPNRRGH